MRALTVSLLCITPFLHAEVAPRTVRVGASTELKISNPNISPTSKIVIWRVLQPTVREDILSGLLPQANWQQMSPFKVRLNDGEATFEVSPKEDTVIGEYRVRVKNGSSVSDVGYFIVLDRTGKAVVLSNARVASPPKMEGNRVSLHIQVDFDCPQGARFDNLMTLRVPKRNRKAIAASFDPRAMHYGEPTGTLDVVFTAESLKPKSGQSLPFWVWVGIGTGHSQPAEGTLVWP